MAEKLITLTRDQRTGSMEGSMMLELDTYEPKPLLGEEARAIAHALRPIDPNLRNGGLIHLSQTGGESPKGAIIYPDGAHPLPAEQAHTLAGIARNIGSRRPASRL